MLNSLSTETVATNPAVPDPRSAKPDKAFLNDGREHPPVGTEEVAEAEPAGTGGVG